VINAALHVECFGQTRPQHGRQHTQNQDAFVVGRPPVPWAAVLDGAGNAQAVAKRAAGIVERWFNEASLGQILRGETWRGLARRLDSALMGGPQSTLVAVALVGRELLGVALALVFKWRRVEEKYVAPDVDRKIAYRAHPALVRAVEMRVQGRYRAARLALAGRPDDLDAWRERYEIAAAEGELREAVDHATRLLGLYVGADEPRLAARLVEDVLDRIGPHIPPRFYRVAGARMEAVGEMALAWLLYECLRTRHPDDPGVPMTLVREGRALERDGSRDEARERWEAARRHRECTVALREAADRALEIPAKHRPGQPGSGRRWPLLRWSSRRERSASADDVVASREEARSGPGSPGGRVTIPISPAVLPSGTASLTAAGVTRSEVCP
jgi:hypothetical protein